MEIITQKGDPVKIIDEPFAQGEKMFVNFLTRERISKLLKNAGFKIIFQEEEETTDPLAIGQNIIYTIARKV